MESQVIRNVQDSFRKVEPIAETAAAIFYAKLFEKDPSLRLLFKGDMKEQGRKLMTMLAMAVNSLTNMDAFLPVLQNLGRRHVGYGVTDGMYNTVGTALLETLEAGLGDDFTPEVKDAWSQVYATLATIMKDASH